MTEGGTRKDESVSFSLRELKKLEDERIEREERARADDASRIARARADADARDRQARERAEAEEREARRRQEQDELLKREALQRAALEQTRLEVEVRARADERERERRHEIELASARAATASSGFGMGALAGSAVVGAVLGAFAAFAIHMTVTVPANERRLAESERALAVEKQHGIAVTAELDREKAKRGEDAARIAQLGVELENARNVTGPRSGPKGPGVRIPTTPRGTTAPRSEAFSDKCANGDPLCGLSR